MIVLYSALLATALLVSSPWWLLRLLTTDRYREGLGERLGAVPARLRGAVRGKRVVWVHAVSVGEVLAASRLLKELETALGEEWRVVISTTTRTGQALARERFGAERVFYFPLDFAWSVRAYLRALRPSLLVLMESELWPRILHECERSGIPVAVVNARISDRSFSRALRMRSVWKRTLRKISLWLTQSEEDARRLVTMGANPQAVHAGGNLKYDVRASRDNAVADQIQEWAGQRAIIVAGSTCGPLDGGNADAEESMLFKASYDAVHTRGEAMLVIAPRHPERFREAESTVSSLRYRNASGKPAGPPAGADATEVVVLDTIGDLAAVYGVADVAFVGGSLVQRGGHNPLEPAQFGVPVVMGPSFENFRDIVGHLQAADAIQFVTRETLQSALDSLLEDPSSARAMGERARGVFEQQQGATARAVAALLDLLSKDSKSGTGVVQ